MVTIPLRDDAAGFRPLGPLCIIKHLRNEGFGEVDLYDIDHHRPSFEEAVAKIVAYKPDVLGISAVVSTSYDYTKMLSVKVREHLPECLIVMGGNMGASAEIILRQTEVDIVVLDDGEIPFLEICRFSKNRKPVHEYSKIKGLVLLGKDSKLINTGYGDTIPLDKMWAFDFEDIVKAHGTLDHIVKLAEAEGFKNIWYRDQDIVEGSRVATLDVSKGCVARCTFCHRWTKGLRHVPIPELEKRLLHLVKNYGVRYIDVNAESFGNDKRWLVGYLDMMKKYQLTWRANGVRANTFDEEWIKKCKDAGCTYLGFGNETGSVSMLKIMEKKVDIQDNYNAMKWTIKNGLQTGVALVLGMPGESPSTVQETIEYTKFCVTLSKDFDPNNLSINYAQALPGTALYEFGRSKGLIGRSLEEEEEYLITISDRNAHDETATLNFTEYPTLIHRTWRPRITIETNYHYVMTFGLDHYRQKLPRSHALMYEASGFFANPRRLMEQGVGNEGSMRGFKVRPPSLLKYILGGRFGAAMLWYPILFYRMRHILPLLILIKTIKDEGFAKASELLVEYIKFTIGRVFKNKGFSYDFKSLRKIVEDDIGELEGDDPEMAPLRKGR